MASSFDVDPVRSSIAMLNLVHETVGNRWAGPIVVLGDGAFSHLSTEAAKRFPCATVWSVDPEYRKRKPRLSLKRNNETNRKALKKVNIGAIEAERFSMKHLGPPGGTAIILSKRAHTSTPGFAQRVRRAGFHTVVAAVVCHGFPLPGTQRWVLRNPWDKPVTIGGMNIDAPQASLKIREWNRRFPVAPASTKLSAKHRNSTQSSKSAAGPAKRPAKKPAKRPAKKPAKKSAKKSAKGKL